MKNKLLTIAALAALQVSPLAGRAVAQEPLKVEIPKPGVPQIMTMEGRYIRVAYNNEGYAILGYRLANLSVGEPWILLEVGLTVREGVPDYTLKREAISLDTPDGKNLPLPTIEHYREANLNALQAREKVQRDSINYFPPSAYQACRIGFFADLEDRVMSWNETELGSQRACLGRLYFEIPGGVAYGQYWLNVKFEKSLVRVPFRILTKEEDKKLDKNFKSIQKQVEEAFKKPKS